MPYLSAELLEVEDATRDPRFADNPLVLGPPKIRFYAGMPLTLSTGKRIGTLCVIDRRARRLAPRQHRALAALAQAARCLLERRSRQRQEIREPFLHLMRLSDVVRCTSHAVIVTDAGGRTIWVNDGFTALTGYAPEDILGRKPGALLQCPETSVEAVDAIRAALRRGEGCRLDILNKTKDARKIWLDLEIQPVRDASGAVSGFVAIESDITDRKAQELTLRQSEAMLASIGDLAQVGGWVLELDGSGPIWSDETCRIHGVPPGYRPGLDEAIQFYAPEARPAIQAAVERGMREGTPWDLELPFVTRDGRSIWVRAMGRVEFEDGRPVRLYGAFQDITQRRRVEAKLREEHELLQVTLRSIAEAVITTDAQGLVTWLNPVAERLTGWAAAKASGKPVAAVLALVDEDSRRPLPDPVAEALSVSRVVQVEGPAVLVGRGGDECAVESSAAPIVDGDGSLLGAVLVLRDVSEQRRVNREMRFRASHDALTGLFNRVELEARLARALDETRAGGVTHTLMYIDLDRFKVVNDTCGHAVGDRLLQQVAQLFSGIVRSRDFLARIGGDEFAALLEHCTPEQARRVAQQICDRMEAYRFEHEGHRFRIGASIGLAPVDAELASMEAVMQAADLACLAAKEAGRSRVHVWRNSDPALLARQGETRWAARLERALDEDRFVLFAQRIQPLEDVSAGLHVEILLRLDEGDGELLSPAAFLPAAERFHLASRIDRWVLRKVLAEMSTGGVAAPLELVSVNLSGQSVGDRAFHRDALALLEQAGEEVCRRLCLEITETAAVTNMADASLFVDEVRRLGVRVSLDDFGAGTSSFGYLKSFPVDYLKIDGQFIRDLLHDPLDEVAVRSFVEAARVLGLETVAEFVDRPEVLDRVRSMGVRHAQGFLLHRPQPLAQCLAALARTESTGVPRGDTGPV